MRHRSDRFNFALLRNIYRSMGEDYSDTYENRSMRGWGTHKTFIVTRASNVKHLDVLWALKQIREWASSLRENRAMRILPPLARRSDVGSKKVTT